MTDDDKTWEVKADFAKDSDGSWAEEYGEPIIELSYGYLDAEDLEKVYTTVKDARKLRDRLNALLATYEESKLPYILETKTKIVRKYNPLFGDNKVCKCGHPYHRHFDSYEDMRNVGCKYCPCHDFVGRVCEHRDE